MDVGIPARSLLTEVSETVLLLAICGFTLAGWIGIAMFFVQAVK